ncbi:hypothetical protein FH972_022787 [Carpinus fangiana]|uniref:FHA domain-containing protein n=1 Tax=Carpinus fangiana TaxID=176857 RepID=A0A5N6KTA3_9ROSI|nr:hypothetical protein FH972_022787 [Carpinus fangiana]
MTENTSELRRSRSRSGQRSRSHQHRRRRSHSGERHERRRHRDRSGSRDHSHRAKASDRDRSPWRARRDEREDNNNNNNNNNHSGSRHHANERRRSRSRRRDTDPNDTSRRHHRTHHSPRRSRSPERPSPPARARNPLPSQTQALAAANGDPTAALAPAPEKQKPNFKPTGLLAAATNTVTLGAGPAAQHIVLKYHEPPEARKPPAAQPWALYVFKGAQREPLATLRLGARSCWLFGREAAVADVPTEHPSCSLQHAVLQFRHVVRRDEFGEQRGRVGLYVLDLESSNGTWLNGERVAAARYVGLRGGDVLRFGESEREYVLVRPEKGG